MDSDKMRELLDDVSGEGSSNCCGAAVYELGESYICKDCKEHCDVEKDEEPVKELTPKQEETIEKLMKDKGDWMEPFPDVDKS